MNDKTYVAQVGGTHYLSEYQHWDWAIDLKLPYLEGNATKYISRWRSAKGEGLKDLRKALSYIDKLTKVSDKRELPVEHATLMEQTRRFAKVNNLTSMEYHSCLNIAGWQDVIVLLGVREAVDRMIRNAEAKAVPLTDSNKHAERGTPEGIVEGSGSNACEQDEGA